MAVALPPHSAADSIAADAEEAGKGQLIAQQLLLAALKRGELGVEAPDIVDSNGGLGACAVSTGRTPRS